ncbi:MAG: acetylxylan esterase [Cyclobacteriaceae bacterium]|nr:acetylxylan esterase [Cyclobacteriaceae bacterium]
MLNRIYRNKTNYDEYQVPRYLLPDPLKGTDGKAIADPSDWNLQRRKEILGLFENHVYGKVPEGFSPELVFETHESDANALGGKATRRQVSIRFKNDPGMHSIDVLMYIPNDREGPAPAFTGLSFYGNPTIHPDPAIRMTDKWMRNNEDFKIQNNRLSEASRGVRSGRWPVEKIIDRGYALITAYYGDLDPDMYHAYEQGIYQMAYKDGQTHPAPDEWGSLAVWAWGLSRIMDYLELDRDIDSDRVAVMGHSRIGKTALWAGATDDRFAIVISNNSGCGGAALSRRRFGETVAVINTSFPHWFCNNFNKFNNREDELPLDQHMLLSLIAPRPLYVASALEDRWADPKGEFLSAYHASRVYELLGYKGLPVDEMPSVNQPVMGTIGYHIREGKHDVTDYDWEQYMNFADKHFGRK